MLTKGTRASPLPTSLLSEEAAAKPVVGPSRPIPCLQTCGWTFSSNTLLTKHKHACILRFLFLFCLYTYRLDELLYIEKGTTMMCCGTAYLPLFICAILHAFASSCTATVSNRFVYQSETVVAKFILSTVSPIGSGLLCFDSIV
jgi:hypothetical protein